MTKLDKSIVKEIEEQRPPFLVGLLSREEKDRLIERGIVGLYRWYISVSQKKRNWNPDEGFDWSNLRRDLSPEMGHILKGFFAVEQFVPDYVLYSLNMLRRSHGRSHFQIRWGSEEEKHSDLWYNTLLFSRTMEPDAIREYLYDLRGKHWALPWEDPLHLMCYVVIQERATQVNYINTALVAQGKSDKPQFANDIDPVLAKVARTIASDEAAHYNFFLEVLRLNLYYYPAETIEALQDVVVNFAMPADQFIPDFHIFADALYEGGIYGPREYSRDVLKLALKNLGVAGRKALEQGVRVSRQVPDDKDGNIRDTSFFETLDYDAVEDGVRRMFSRFEKYETQVGITEVDPAPFVPSGMNPRSK